MNIQIERGDLYHFGNFPHEIFFALEYVSRGDSKFWVFSTGTIHITVCNQLRWYIGDDHCFQQLHHVEKIVLEDDDTVSLYTIAPDMI